MIRKLLNGDIDRVADIWLKTNLKAHYFISKQYWKGYARALIEFIVNNYREQYAILQVGTGDSPLTIPFYEKCGFVRSHIISNFFTDNYDHPIYESGVQLVDMVYLQRPL